MFGLTQQDINSIISVLREKDEIEEALIFGSRAKGNFKKQSDVDIVLKGQNINHSILNEVSFLLNEETMMPYKFDVINQNTINNPDLKEHIERVGIPIFTRG